MIYGLVLLALVLLYRLLVYASYLEVKEARFSDKGGLTTIHVETDAVFVSLNVYSGEWFTINQSGKNIIVDVKENKGAKNRQMSFTILTGLIDDWCKIRKEVVITQTGKGATYINAEPQSIELTERGYNGASTRTVWIETDGDKWEIVTCPDWVWCKKDGNKLELSAKTATEQNREGMLLLKSHNEYTNVRVTQKMKPKLELQSPNSPIEPPDRKPRYPDDGMPAPRIPEEREVFVTDKQFKEGRYTGTLVDNKREGRGVFIFNNGDKYEGEWKDNDRHGHGVYMYYSGMTAKYDGDWITGEQHGHGICYYRDGSRYIGDFRHGLASGSGKTYLSNGEIHEGLYKRGLPNGKGKEYYSNGNLKYEGDFKDGLYDGMGTYYFPSGNKYTGLFNKGEKAE